MLTKSNKHHIPGSKAIIYERKMRKQTPIFIIIVIISIFLLYCFSSTVESATPIITFSREYGPFYSTHYDIFEVIKPASISNDALQLTPDSASPDINMNMGYNSARILLREPFRLWEDDDQGTIDASEPHVASFNTSFLINVFRFRDDTTGEGLAFLIAPDLLLPPNSIGQFLGLTNSMTENQDETKLVAVELDTSKQYFDPDNNHIGVDVNSVKSVKTEPLTPHNITIAPISGTKLHNIWVDYDGFKMVLDVYMAEQEELHGETPPKPGSPILSVDLNLRDHVNQHSYFGFSASSGNDSQLNSVLRWNLTVHHFSDPEMKLDKSVKIMRGAGAAVLATVGVLLLAAVWFGYRFYKNRVAALDSSLVAALRLLPGTPREFKFKDLKKVTNDFDEKNKLGQGGFGVVYKGILVQEKMDIAVKWFSRGSIKGQHDFLAELTIINRLRHKHLVKLLGWCHKNGKLLLVYEYMPNGSLDQHLFVGPHQQPLQWNLRHKIVLGVASSLHYLHNEYDQKVVHRDLKASNIMLDTDFNARLGDFGLARALDNDKTSYLQAEGVIGTMGYIAPECFLTGKATQYSDVYAFGAVLLEVVCGQRPGTRIDGFQFLVDWVWMMHREGKLLEAVDRRLGDGYIVDEAERLLLLGLACSHPNGGERPKTEAILQIVLGTVAVPLVPPFRPAFVLAAPSGEVDVDSVNTMSITVSDLAR